MKSETKDIEVLNQYSEVLFYVETVTPRLVYTTNLFFRQILGVNVQFTTQIEEFTESILPKINYSNSFISNSLFVQSSPILFENNIKQQDINIGAYKGVNCIFYHDNHKALLPFDPLAMTFYLVSRYEEYLPSKVDKFGRFQPSESIAFRYDFLDIPIVQKAAFWLKDELQKYYPTLQFKVPKYQFTPTYDIDLAYAYLHRNLTRTLGGVARDILKFNPKNLWRRLRVLAKTQPDPYYTFDILDQKHQTYHLSPIYFFLIGEYGEHDKNIDFSREALQQLIFRLSKKYEIGIHPSFGSNTSIDVLKGEVIKLSNLLKNKTLKSRQHYLKLHFPQTYRRLLEVGIQEEYTLGYAQALGFRAGIALPYYWYDLEKEKETSLKIYPFQVMDVTLQYYLKLSPQAAVQRVEKLIEETKAVGGHFMTLWHNNSLAEIEGWEGWLEAYDSILQKAKP